MAWSLGDKRPSKDGLVGHGPRPECPICRDTDCVCPQPEHDEPLRKLTQCIGDEPPPRCSICGDTDCVCPPPEHTRLCRETAAQWVTKEPRPKCTVCGDTDCVCPPFEDDRFFLRGMARFI